MANSIDSGVNNVIVANSAFQAFQKKLQSFAAFSTSFSSEAAQPGSTIKVLKETYPDEAAATKSANTAYTIQDADSTTVSITLGQPIYTSFQLDDVERASSSVVGLERFAQGKGNHVANAVLQTVWDDITNANFASKVTVATASFDLDDVYDMKDLLDDNDAPEDGRSLVLSNAVATNLLKDASITGNLNAGDAPLRQGSLGTIAGMDVYTTNVLPGNSENLTGFACVSSAFAVGMRYLQPAAGHKYSRAEAVTDSSGITLGVREWYDENSGNQRCVMEAVVGSAVGQGTGLVRLVSA